MESGFAIASPTTAMTEGRVKSSSYERPSIDQLFRALSHPWRRFVLRQLYGRPLPTTTASLARAVVRAETRRIEGDRRLRPTSVESSLVHVHLPMLEAVGLIRWNRETSSVSLSPAATRMQIVPQLADDTLQRTWFGSEANEA